MSVGVAKKNYNAHGMNSFHILMATAVAQFHMWKNFQLSCSLGYFILMDLVDKLSLLLLKCDL